MPTVVIGTHDLYEFFVAIDMPGVRKEAVRLATGVLQGDAGVIGEGVQAAVNPSAGQAALQAGEAVQGPGAGFMSIEQVVSVMTDMKIMMGDFINAQTVVNSAVGDMSLKMIEIQATQARQETAQAQLQAQMAQVQGQLGALGAQGAQSVAGNGAGPRSKARPRKAKPGAGAAPAGPVEPPRHAPGTAPCRNYRKIPEEAKAVVYEWLVRHIKHPFPTAAELEELRQQCEIDTCERMRNLVSSTRHRCLQKDQGGRGPYSRIRWSLPKPRPAAWVQTGIGAWLRE